MHRECILPTMLATRPFVKKPFLRVGRARRRAKRLPRQQEPKAIERAYSKELRAFVDVCREAVKAILLPQLPGLLKQAAVERGDAWRHDASGRQVRELMGRVKDVMAKSVTDLQLERLARDMAGRTSRFQKEQLDRQVRAAVGADVFAAEPNLSPLAEAFVESNVALIKSIPEQAFTQVETLVQQAVRGGARHEQLAQDIAGRFDVAESRASLIARDQTLKFYGELNKARQTALGVEAYIWRATPDSRTRPEHEERDGKRYLWSEPPADGHPGAAVNCRCSAEPDLESALEALGTPEPTATPVPPRAPRRARQPKAAPPPSPAPPPEPIRTVAPAAPVRIQGDPVLAAQVAAKHPVLNEVFGDRLRVTGGEEIAKALDQLGTLPDKMLRRFAPPIVEAAVGEGTAKDVSPEHFGDSKFPPAGAYSRTDRVLIAGTKGSSSHSVLVHEFGHAVDWQLDDERRAEFRAIWAPWADKKRKVTARLSYYTNPDFGFEETFAESLTTFHVKGEEHCRKQWGDGITDYMKAFFERMRE
jgi:SPP1 gp7 family putative phage head morphogenesis protein